jgi:hypothetical protein
MGKVVAIVGLLAMMGAVACGGATKPPMQPDGDDPTAALGDGGAGPATAQPPATPAPR